MAELTFLVIASFCTSVLSGMIGLAGGSILMVLVLTVMPPAQAIPFHGVVQLVATSSRVVLFRRETAWALVGRYAVLLIPGVAVGMLLFRGMPQEAVTIAIGSYSKISFFSYYFVLQVFKSRKIQRVSLVVRKRKIQRSVHFN